jgi:hypothetical protein
LLIIDHLALRYSLRHTSGLNLPIHIIDQRLLQRAHSQGNTKQQEYPKLLNWLAQFSLSSGFGEDTSTFPLPNSGPSFLEGKFSLDCQRRRDDRNVSRDHSSAPTTRGLNINPFKMIARAQ